MLAVATHLLLEILSNPASVPAGPAPVQAREVLRRVDAKTQTEKLVAFFHAHPDDELFTVRDIAEETGPPRNTVNALLSSSSEKHFLSRIHVGPKRVLWGSGDLDGDSAQAGPEEREADQSVALIVDDLPVSPGIARADQMCIQGLGQETTAPNNQTAHAAANGR